jgi:RNA polymerase sigma factor (sigma-70 family)
MPIQPQINERVLFQQLADGSEKQMNPIHTLYSPQIMKYCDEIIPDKVMAEAITLETLVTLWENRAEVAMMENPVGWLFRCAERKSLNWLRDEKRRQTYPLDEKYDQENQENMEGVLEGREISRLISLAIKKLPEQQKKIMQLKLQMGLKRAEIASLCNLAESTVKNQITSGHKKLRIIMDGIYKDYLR